MFFKIFKNIQIKLLFVFLSIFLLFITSNKVLAYKDNEIYERTIRGTEIVHVVLDKNANSYDVLNYIQNNFNFSFNNSVSNTPSYNKEKNDALNCYIKDSDDDLLAVYFDGGFREGRNENYDFIDLRWLGNGSPHIYFFWKIDKTKKVLEHDNIIKAQHFKNNNTVLELIMDSKKLKNITIKKIIKKIVKKLTKKSVNFLTVGNFVISGIAGVVSEQLVNFLVDILEQKPDALETTSSAISKIEDFIIDVTDIVDDIPGVRNIVPTILEGLKTFGKATGYPVNVFNEIGKSVFKQDYKDFKTSLDLLENLNKGILGVLKGIIKATVNTSKDVGYGIKDIILKLYGQ